ncbi:MAG: tripartite tricarboxylate transporter substrate binding protein [Pseudomonadota bacterium]
MIRKSYWQLLCALVAALVIGNGHAQQYPVRPVTILCWSAAGSPVDLYARIMAKLLSAELGQNVVVENRLGGSGIIMVNTLIRAPADGYVLAANTITLATLFSEPTASFKPEDLQMISRSQVDPYGLIVHTSTPFKTIDDLVAYARKKPNYINVSGPFAMSGHRVAWEVFSEVAKIKATWVPYPGGGPALNAVAGGHVDAAATNPGNVKPLMAAGKVRVLAVSSEQRLDDFPDVPTYKERGWDVVRYQWRGIMAKAGTPKPVVDRLAAAIQKVQQTPEWKAYLKQVTQLDGFQGPDAFRAQLLQDMKEMEVVKKKLGL